MAVMLAAGRWGDFVEWLEGHEASALVLAAFLTFVATVILAIVTGFYARSAGRQAKANVGMVEEMRQQRLIGVQPIVVLSIQGAGYFGIAARAVNVGSGASFDLSIFLESVDRAKEVDDGSNVQVLGAGEGLPLEFRPKHVFDEKLDNSGQPVHAFPPGKYSFVASYLDMYGNRLSAVRPLELVDSSTDRPHLDVNLGQIRFSGYNAERSEE